ncbi:hypothetical protein N7513_001797 [Penicillium frequentans]|nr:hypothetical protein N7513_001797 [Penicillium glabrum]
MEDQNTNNAAIYYEHSLTLEREPPLTLRQGFPFTITVNVKLQGIGASPNRIFVLNVSLRDAEELRPVNAMSGSLTCPIQARTGVCIGHRAQFNGLVIHRPGKFRLRILLATSSFTETTVTARIDTIMIEVGRAAAT